MYRYEPIEGLPLAELAECLNLAFSDYYLPVRLTDCPGSFNVLFILDHKDSGTGDPDKWRGACDSYCYHEVESALSQR